MEVRVRVRVPYRLGRQSYERKRDSKLPRKGRPERLTNMEKSEFFLEGNNKRNHGRI